jgi:tetratricopeptide (TPR) repeat protein
VFGPISTTMFPTHRLKPVRLGFAAGVVAFALCAAPTHAQTYAACDRTPSSSDVEAAKGMHKAAENYYAKARYDKAIASWKEAYSFDCTAHRLLINIGNGYEKLGKTPEAIEAFETYIGRMGANADQTIVDKVKNLKSLTPAQPQPQPDPTPGPNPDPNPQPDPNGNGDTGGDPGIAPWVMVGAGAGVALIGGIVLGVGVQKESSAEEDCPTRGKDGVCPEDIAARGNTGIKMQIAGGVLLGLGLAAAAGGVVWWALASAPGSAAGDSAGLQLGPLQDVQPTPWLTPGFQGIGLTGTF